MKIGDKVRVEDCSGEYFLLHHDLATDIAVVACTRTGVRLSYTMEIVHPDNEVTRAWFACNPSLIRPSLDEFTNSYATSASAPFDQYDMLVKAKQHDNRVFREIREKQMSYDTELKHLHEEYTRVRGEREKYQQSNRVTLFSQPPTNPDGTAAISISIPDHTKVPDSFSVKKFYRAVAKDKSGREVCDEEEWSTIPGVESRIRTIMYALPEIVSCRWEEVYRRD